MKDQACKRLSRRVKFATSSEVEICGLRREATLVDISFRGALVCFRDPICLQPEVPCNLTVYLNEYLVKLSFGGQFVHFSDNRAGIRFTRVDASSMMHLRRLLELNTGDAERVRDELDSFIGMK